MQANGVSPNALVSDCVTALCDNDCCEDHRLDVKLFEKDYNRGSKIEVNSMLTSLEKKHMSLKKSNQWSRPKKSSVDSKCVALLVSDASENNKLKGLFQHILLSSSDESLKTALLASGLKAAGIGSVCHKIVDDNNNTLDLQIDRVLHLKDLLQ